jgi:RimJ/RimL family protein N-acetyltransferase
MTDLKQQITDAITGNDFIRDCYTYLSVEGENPWEMTLKSDWKDVGKMKVSSFDLSDFWALRDWWRYSLNYQTKCLFPLFPSDERLDRCIANHFKNHESRRDIIFNAWSIKEGSLNEDFNNEIIGHFFLLQCNSDNPYLGLGVASNYQGKKLGTFFISLISYVAKNLGKQHLWLTTGKDNIAGYKLYKKMGFEDAGDIEVYVPAENYKRIDTKMKLDLKKFK